MNYFLAERLACNLFVVDHQAEDLCRDWQFLKTAETLTEKDSTLRQEENDGYGKLAYLQSFCMSMMTRAVVFESIGASCGQLYGCASTLPAARMPSMIE